VEDNTTNDTSSAVNGTAATTAEPSELQRQRDEYYDLLLRKSAEFDNYRKRVDRDRQTLSDAAAASMIEELLPLIHRQLGEILRKRGVRAIEVLGADFDPYYHQAVAHEPAEGRREGEIIEEFRRGYMLGDRLLRPSMVKVAKG
jgi:molecular chaperone GrpE